jgi:hypothetical protein
MSSLLARALAAVRPARRSAPPPPAQRGVIAISDAATRERIRVIGITEAHLGTVARWRQTCLDGLGGIAEAF